MFPFHTWLPDAHVEAPTAGSVILAGVLLKLGGYGLLRFALPLFPTRPYDLAPLIIVLSLIGIVYGAIVAIVQPDLKKLVAYCSVSHMGFVTLGIFVFTEQGLQGAVLQMIAHGIITGALFLLRRRHLRAHPRPHDRQDGRPGRAPCRSTPRSSASSCWPRLGLPGLAGFVGEFLVDRRRVRLLPPVVAAIAAAGDDARRGLPAVHVPARRLRRPVRLPQGHRPSPDRHEPH